MSAPHRKPWWLALAALLSGCGGTAVGAPDREVTATLTSQLGDACETTQSQATEAVVAYSYSQTETTYHGVWQDSECTYFVRVVDGSGYATADCSACLSTYSISTGSL